MSAFVTGSCAYGTTHDESDIDVNLILFADAREMAAWRDATNQLKERKPVLRFEAVTLIKQLVAEYTTVETFA